MMKKDFYKTAAKLLKKYKPQPPAITCILVLTGACALSFMAGRSTVVDTEGTQQTVADAQTGSDPAELPGISPGTPSFVFPPYAEYADATPSNAEIMDPSALNLASLYGEDADTAAVTDSYAGRLYESLTALDARWFSGIYDLYSYTPEQMAAILGLPLASVTTPSGIIPEFRNLSIQFINGDRQTLSGTSNARDIISMVNVLHYFGLLSSLEEMEAYAGRLWNASHSYTVTMGDVYYCDGGCLGTNAMPEEGVAGAGTAVSSESAVSTASPSMASPSMASPSTASPSAPSLPASSREPEAKGPESAGEDEAQTQAAQTDAAQKCPGHVDCTILALIKGSEETKGLFKLPAAMPSVSDKAVSGIKWDDTAISYVRELMAQDWYGLYGLNTSDIPMGNPLTAQEIELYMELVPEDASETRKGFIRYALSSVGKIPYYWGGKPSAPGYTGNNFGALTTPDEDGRLLKGLDCSGWVNWVYWSVTGRGLGAQSTGTLLGSGIPVTKDQLQPGDICIRTGPMSHVVIFLGWTEKGQMICIQETTGHSNNVEVGVKEANWQSYRRIIE